jgi:hypothetical protein
MSDLRADMSGGNRICPPRRRICPTKQVLALWKSRSGAKTIRLGHDKLTTCTLDTIEHI